jgi:Uncharacterized low-complexity proteins
MNASDIGEKIATARKLKNLSQTDLAGLVSVTSQAVGKWERGESMPDMLMFIRLAEILGVDLNYFGGVAKSYNTSEKVDSPTNPAPREKNMSLGNWEGGNFSGLKDLGKKFSGSNIKCCEFKSSDLSGLSLRGNNIDRCNFSESNLSESALKGCNIDQVQFTESNFSHTLLKSCNIDRCDFSHANLTDTKFDHSNIDRITFNGAVFEGTNFIHSSLDNLALTGKLIDCSFETVGVTARVEFRDVILINCFFKNCNLKKVRFTGNCKADNISLAFLKSNKANVDEIEQIISYT